MVNAEAAATKVREFLELVEATRGRADQSGLQVRDRVNAMRPLIERIAEELDPLSQPANFQPHAAIQGAWPYARVRDAAVRLLGILEGKADEDEIFLPRGPALAAAGLHEWVWNAAADLWDDGHYMQAVGEAAKRIDLHLQNKMGRPDLFGTDLVTEAFNPKEATSANPRLRFSEIPKGKQWQSAHEGAMHFGRGCMQAIRNRAAHDASPISEQEALEYLAALSVLARWIDHASVVTEE